MKVETLARARILIVDDQQANILVLQGILDKGGYANRRGVTDARQAVAAWEEYQLDLILLDLIMPYLDGVAVMEQLRPRVPPDDFLPILVLTADTTLASRQRALQAGANDFLTKPLDVDEVLLRIQNLLRTRFLYRAQQQQASEQQLRLLQLLDQAQDGILVHDLDGRITFWSKGAERLYGWPAAEAVGKLVRDLLYRSPYREFDAAQRALLEKGHWSGELTAITREKKEILVASRWTLASGPDGQAREVLVISTDITEKKQLEQQLLRSQRMDSIGALAGGIAHDLNNALAPIMMGVQILAAMQGEARGRDLLKTMEASARRGADLVRQVLLFARGSEGERQPVQIDSLVKEVHKILTHSLPKNIEFRLSVPKELWLVPGEPTHLYQVLMNLCVNARDAMPRGGTLTLSAENVTIDETFARMQDNASPGPHVVLKVADTGVGIPPEVLERIFEPFFTTKELGKGTGLGLATALGIVKAHGGFFRVDTQVGRGSEFAVYLPAQPAASTARASELPELPVGKGEMILVVDDEAAILATTQAALEPFGYRVLTASDGGEAVAAYLEHKDEVRLVITDSMMPLMDGPAMIQALRRLNPAVKVIAASGQVTEQKLADLPKENVKAFLPKPFTAETLLRLVREVLDG